MTFYPKPKYNDHGFESTIPDVPSFGPMTPNNERTVKLMIESNDISSVFKTVYFGSGQD